MMVNTLHTKKTEDLRQNTQEEGRRQEVKGKSGEPTFYFFQTDIP